MPGCGKGVSLNRTLEIHCELYREPRLGLPGRERTNPNFRRDAYPRRSRPAAALLKRHHKYCRSESSVQSYRTDAIVPVLVAVTLHLPCAKVRDARSGDRGETLVVRVVKDGDGDATVHLNRTDLVVKSIRNVHHRTARLAEVVAAEIGTGEKTRAVMRPAAGPSGTRIPPGRTAVVRSHPELRAAPTIDPDPPVIVAPALAAHTGRTARLPHQIHALASVTDRTIIASAVPRFASHHIHVGTLRRGRRHDRGICCRRRGLRR